MSEQDFKDLMMDKTALPDGKHNHSLPSARLQYWDYGSNAACFVTICTSALECYFWHVPDREMVLSEIGKIVR